MEGVDIKELKIESMRKEISICNQVQYLFSESIKFNLMYSNIQKYIWNGELGEFDQKL